MQRIPAPFRGNVKALNGWRTVAGKGSGNARQQRVQPGQQPRTRAGDANPHCVQLAFSIEQALRRRQVGQERGDGRRLNDGYWQSVDLVASRGDGLRRLRVGEHHIVDEEAPGGVCAPSV